MQNSTSKDKAEKAKKYYRDTPKSGLKPDDLLCHARLELLQNFPFWGKVAHNMTLVETDKVPTTAVDARGNLYYNPKWVNGWSKTDATFEFAHEVGHLVQRLFMRVWPGIIHHIWNLAADYHDDYMLIQGGLKQSAISQEMVTKEKQEWCEIYQTVPAMYKFLLQKAEEETNCPGCKALLKQVQQMDKQGKKEKQQAAQQQHEQQETGASAAAGDGENPGEEHSHDHGDGGSCGGEMPEHTCGNIRMCCAGMSTDTDNMEPEDFQKWTEVVIAAQQHAKSRGNMPAGLSEMIDGLTKSKVRWQDHLLKDASRIFGRSMYTFKRPARRGHAIGLRMPHKTPDAYTAVGVMDTSGSMSSDSIKQCLSEFAQILKICGCKRLWLILHDAVAYYSGWVDEQALTKLQMARGGTSHEEVWQILERRHKTADFNVPKECEVKLVVAFTDLGTLFPDYIPDYEVIWAVPADSWNDNVQVPFGKKVKVEM